jgi:hypothetical protein
MPPWYNGVSTGARTAARGSDWRSARCAARVRRGDTRAAKYEAHRGAGA